MREENPHLRDDLRIAWIVVVEASRGNPQPHVAATYKVLGLHPDRVWSAIIERRKALLGSHYNEFWGETLPPKKTPQSERASRRNAHAA